MDEQKLEKLQTWVKESSRIVFFGGAGVSTESGIPDFRGEDGLYRQRYAYPPETIISHSFYRASPGNLLRFLPKPHALSEREAQCSSIKDSLSGSGTESCWPSSPRTSTGCTQMAGSRNVYELHGSVHRNTCQKCGARYTLAQMLTLGDVPKCPKCGGRVKPDVVLYEEGLDPLTISGALDAIRRADLLIVAGTSLTVYPAAAFLDEYPGNRLVLINKTGHPAGRYRESGAA